MFKARSILHCKACGGAVRYEVPADDNRERAVCMLCKTIEYENPINVVGTVPAWGDQVLLCRRNIEPRYGYWTLPAGFLEIGETSAEGVLNVVRVAQLHLYYRARLLDTEFAPGTETIEARLFREDEIPWDELAFRTVRETLKRFFDDHRKGQFGVHCADIA
jgi:hypothetical protein